MPEGDTIHLAATRLHAALAGDALTRSDLRVPRLATTDLAGRTIENVRARGKHVLMRLDGGLTLHSHLRMEGAWHLYRAGEAWRGGPDWQVRAVLQTASWRAVGYRLPVLALFPTADEPQHVGHLGPDPLGDDWDADEALRRLLADPERTISEALLDQRVIAGIGNVWRCELCFLRGLDPWMAVGAVRDPARLVDLVKRAFEVNRGTGNHITTGDPRAPHYVYGREGRPCRRCRSPVSRRDGERVTYWCSSCQPARR
ncbi:MAG: DNA-formamidopyrimidine glycosylase family protein [Deltaproteobacteria bacterium]|nr:DNA-formamidopyrimidine glycosylase family protein [Deltaproteobacteria bacterium]